MSEPNARSEDESSAGVARLRRETAEDVRLYVEIGLAPVRCGECGVQAMVKKNSVRHTSIQWTAQSAAGCPVISAAPGPGTTGASERVLGCPNLRASIDAAVADGRLVVPDA